MALSIINAAGMVSGPSQCEEEEQDSQKESEGVLFLRWAWE